MDGEDACTEESVHGRHLPVEGGDVHGELVVRERVKNLKSTERKVLVHDLP